MGKFKVISRTFEHMSDYAITIEKQQRVCLNAAFARELDHKQGNEYFLYYDDEDQRIGISKTAEANAEPYRFDDRGNASARGFIRQTDFKTEDGSIKFIFDGKEGDIYAFRLPGRKHVTLKQDKNGNLEKC
ncbi:hypothetical protein [Paenibacillus apii]|uniref:hypothetical protein n=1 Tax=Paenibacillus apii TaxID=1850370 RepID=UPI00143B06BA|nr:hypothetical protein [Paenibacillus apii]NJJ38575.1 hypothetical protein [Paenibacillus apii]